MEKILDKITRAAMLLSTVLFGLVMVAVVINVVGRSFFNLPLKPTMEIVQYGMLTAVALAASRTTLLKRHIAVTILIDKFPFRVKSVLQAIEWLICAGAFVVLAVSYFNKISVAVAMNKVTDLLKIPHSLLYAIMAVLMLLTALIFLFQMVESIMDTARGHEKENKLAEAGENNDE